jgi:hypothetical protein
MVADFSSGFGQGRALAVLTGAMFTHPVHSHAGSGGGQVFGKSTAQPASGSGDQGDLAFKKSRHC